MPYALIFSNRWEKDFKSLDNLMAGRTKEALKKLAQDPHIGKELGKTLRGVWSYRIWKYRLLFTINESTKEVTAHTIGHRKDVYKLLHLR